MLVKSVPYSGKFVTMIVPRPRSSVDPSEARPSDPSGRTKSSDRDEVSPRPFRISAPTLTVRVRVRVRVSSVRTVARERARAPPHVLRNDFRETVINRSRQYGIA